MSTARIHLGDARALADAYDAVAGQLTTRRQNLAGPLATAERLLSRSPDTDIVEGLRTLSERLVRAGDDLRWRVDYLEALGAQVLDDGRYEGDIPVRSYELRNVSDSDLLEQLGDTGELTDRAVTALLVELTVRAASDPSVAAAAIEALGPAGLDQLAGRAGVLMRDEVMEAGRAFQARWDPVAAAKFDMEAFDEGGWAAAWLGPSPGTDILDPLGVLVGEATRAVPPPVWLADHLLSSDADASQIATTLMLASAGIWDDELLEATWGWLLDLDPQEMLLANSWVPGNSSGALTGTFTPPLFEDRSDPVEIVLAAIGRNPLAAWEFTTQAWDRPTIDLVFDRRELNEELYDWVPSFMPDVIVHPGSRLDSGLGRLFTGAAEYPGTLSPATREAVLERTWPSFLDIMEQAGDKMPGDHTRVGLALLTTWRWPQLAGFGPDGDHGSRDFFSELVRHDVALGVLALGLGSYTQPLVVDATIAHSDGRPIEYYGNEISFAWQHLFAGLDEAGHLKTQDFGIIASALEALGGHGVKQGLAAIGAPGGIPGVLLTWGGGQIVSAVVGEIVPGAEPLDIPEGDDYFRQFFFPTSSVERPDGTPVRDVSVFQVDVATALFAADPALLDGLAPSPFVVDGRVVMPADDARAGEFAAWFRELTSLDGSAWTDTGANDAFAHDFAEVTAELANQVDLGIDR